MSCCTSALFLPPLFANATTTRGECADFCYHHPETCTGYVFSDTCKVCNHPLEPCSNANNFVSTRPTPCHGNVCVATYGDVINVHHETTIFISSDPNKYVPYSDNNLDAFTNGSIVLHLNVSSPRNLTIVGPGVVSATLPLKLGKHVNIKKNVEFRQCSNSTKATAALLLHEGGKVHIEGLVYFHYARALVTVVPKLALGETVVLQTGSTITYRGDDERVCAAAFSHVQGTVDVQCSNNCFTVTQDLDGTENLQLHENSNSTNNVNITSLLNDFGSEYLVQFVDGPANGDSVPTTVAGLLTSLTGTLLILTAIFQQRYFKFFR